MLLVPLVWVIEVNSSNTYTSTLYFVTFIVLRELLKPSILKAWQLAVAAGLQDKLFFAVNRHSEVTFFLGIRLFEGFLCGISQKTGYSHSHTQSYPDMKFWILINPS